MKNKKIIIIIACMAILMLLSYFGYEFFFNLNKNNYDAEKYVFKDCNQVVTFLKNINDTDDVIILSNSNGKCNLECKTSDGEIYKYSFDENTKLLLSNDDK